MDGKERIQGLDLARALALIGMVMVHFGPVHADTASLAGEVYLMPYGRASILFVLLAGVGISLLTRSRQAARGGGTAGLLVWRALILLPIALALAALPVRVAVILQVYAVVFVLGIGIVHLSRRMLAACAVAAVLLGPVLVLLARRTWPNWFTADADRNPWDPITDLLVSGRYPLVVWIVPVLVGVLVGRLNLSSSTVVFRLAIAGFAVAGAAVVARAVLGLFVGTPVSPGDWRHLASIEPHSEMPLWIASSTGIAVAVLAACVAVGRLLTQFAWPLVALGQLALTAYVVHVLLLAAAPQWFLRSTFSEAWLSVGRFVLVALAVAVVWRVFARRGPLEALLRVPVGSVARPIRVVTRLVGPTSRR